MSPLTTAVHKTVKASRWAIGTGGEDGWRDVWSRAGNRTRAAVLLVVDMVLFLGLCLFTYWLRTGQFLLLDTQGYTTLLKRSFRFSGIDQVSLTDMLMGPISIERTPMQVVILALLLAALVTVPVLVAILYRFPFALPFAAMIALAAGLPWLGITAVGACALASLRPFRMGFRFGSALVGLVPFVLYLWLSTRSTGGPPVSSPLDEFKMYSPWMLSLMLAVFNLAVTLSIASIVGYRPGAIAPVLAVLFALPVVLFEAKIGQDELYYSVLESNYGPTAYDRFREEGVMEFLQREQAWEARVMFQRIFARAGDPYEEMRLQWRPGFGAVADLKQVVEDLALQDMEADRGETIRATERFIADFPDSPRVPAALYMQGRAMDTRLDLEALRDEGRLRFYDHFPSGISMPTWRSLAGSYPEHPLASVALHKLAVHALRQQDVAGASESLRKVLLLAGRRQARPAPPSEGWFAVLMPPPGVDSLGVKVEDVAVQAWELLELIESNAHDPRYGAAPLAVLMRLDPRDRQYRRNLAWLDSRFPGSLLHDDLDLLGLLTSQSVSVRIEELKEHLRRYAGQDSIPRATYELGRLLESDARLDEAVATYEQLKASAPDSVWWDLAAQRAAVLKLQMRR